MSPDTLPSPTEVEAERPALDPLDERAPVDAALFEDTYVEPPFTRAVWTTPLHLVTAAESRINCWTVWNGYTTPDVLTDLGDEYRALRGAAALMDISPLVKYRIAGRDAAAYLDRLVTRDLSVLEVDRALHVVFCEGGGFVLGDGFLFRLDDDEYRLVTEETHLAWLLDSAVGFRVRVEDVSSTLAALSLQGPLSALFLSEMGIPVADLRPFAAHWIEISGMPVYLSRTGASGDLGYELWIDPEDAPHVWSRLLEKCGPWGLRPAGLALRELARLEAGFPRAGVDYLSAFAAIDGNDARTPFDLWTAPSIGLHKPVLNGGAALRRLAHVKSSRRLVPLVVEGLEPARFAAVFSGDRLVGMATSTGFSPALGANIALATLDAGALVDGTLTVRAEMREGVSLREALLPARISNGPAWTQSRRLVVPAPLKL